jgi:4'-phosphopantetheinyl transferase
MLGNEKLWLCAPTEPHRLPNGVRVWAAWLDVDGAALSRFRSALTDHERERAGRFAIERDRARFVAARGFLRTILASCLGTEPQRVELSYSSRGKPSLTGDCARSGMQFNLAHSGNLAVFAVAPHRIVGVDVEQVRPVPDLAELAARFFSTHECAAITKLAGQEQVLTFFRIWTRKEAWLKATGEGITGDLKAIEVLNPPRVERAGGGPPAPLGGVPLCLYDFTPAPAFLGALAVAPVCGV